MKMSEFIDKHGRKFYTIKTAIVNAYWFTLVSTFVLEAIRIVASALKVKEAVDIDLSLAWGFLGHFTWIMALVVAAYCGLNITQHLGLVKLNGNKGTNKK